MSSVGREMRAERYLSDSINIRNIKPTVLRRIREGDLTKKDLIEGLDEVYRACLQHHGPKVGSSDGEISSAQLVVVCERVTDKFYITNGLTDYS